MNARLRAPAAIGLVLVAMLAVAWVLKPLLWIVVPTGVYAVITWPLVRRLRAHMPSALATVLANSALAAVIAGVVMLFGPLLYGQALRLLATLPEAAAGAFAALPAGARDELVRLAGQIDVGAISWARDIFGASLSVRKRPLKAVLTTSKPRVEPAIGSTPEVRTSRRCR